MLQICVNYATLGLNLILGHKPGFNSQKHQEVVMEQENISLKIIFKEFLKEFHIEESKDIIKDLQEPLEGKTIEDMLEIIKNMREAVQDKVDEMYTGTNLERQDVEGFMNNANNFSKREWHAMEKLKKKLEEYTQEFQVASQGAGIREIVKEGRRKSQKKGKLARMDVSNKKWIPM